MQNYKFEMEIGELRFPDLVGQIDYEWLRTNFQQKLEKAVQCQWEKVKNEDRTEKGNADICGCHFVQPIRQHPMKVVSPQKLGNS